MFRSKAFRWALLGIGLLAIIALTGMNVYSLYDIRARMIDGEEERQLSLVDELTRNVWRQIYQPFEGLGNLELEPTESTIENSGRFPPQLHEKIISAAESPLFDGLYYTPEGTDPCIEGTKVYVYNYSTQIMEYTENYPSTLCDGVGLARTKARIELNSFDYRWNNNVEFDAHRTMNIGFINLSENRIIGYLSVSMNKEYIVDDVIAPLLTEYFDPKTNPGTVLWLHDWANNDVLATNNPAVNFDRELINSRKFFPGDMFENWNIKVGFIENPVGALYDETLFKNLFVLGVAMLFVIGALLFMFFTAQKERNLSQRQAGFLANVTHELKTPLAVMQAAGENISDGRVTEKERLKQYGMHIYNESIRLRGMIEKLLDVAKTDSGQTLIKAAPSNLNELVKEYIKENRSYIEEKGFTVSFRYSMDRALIMIDRSHLETVLSNLTENAIKYCGDRKKSIRFKVESEPKNMVLHISDTGIGIPKKHQKNIFKKFYRVEDSLNAKTKGHGLGLSIVKNLIQLNGGTIEVTSEVGKGTTFTIRFPIFVREEEKLKSDKDSDSSTKTVINSSEYA
ncbi:MAG: sensor histidine kinase [Balneola sp.]